MNEAKLMSYYFPHGLRWTALILGLGFAIYLIFSSKNILLPIGLVLTSLVILTSKYEILVDRKNRVIVDGFKVLGLNTSSNKVGFQELNKILINKERHTYTANSRGRTGQTDYFDYIALIQFDKDKSYEILRDVDFEPFINQVNRFAGSLKIKVDRNY